VTPLPEGFRIALDPATRSYRGGRVLVGGNPGRIIRLTDRGLAAVRELQARGDLQEGAMSLGRRLVDAGLAHPRPRLPRSSPDVTVVVPVHDRVHALVSCLGALEPETRVIVVDDGSTDAAAVAAVCEHHGARLIRRERCGGPAAARNTALARVRTDLVAFVDSDCVPEPDWLSALVGHFADPLVGAAAPRLVPMWQGTRHTVLRRFASVRPPLDMGPREGEVAPGRRVPYVPAAALVVRLRALQQPFDAELRYGEDVDLVWRLHDAGWRVRYEPRAIVRHLEPDSWPALLRRRRSYGTSAAALSTKHPGRLAPAVLRPWPTAAAALLVARRPLPALVATALQGAVWAHRVGQHGVPRASALLWSGRVVTETLVGIGRAATTLAAPALIAALCSRRSRYAALTLISLPALEQWVQRRPELDPVRWTVACFADDVAYGLGVWSGCLRERTAGPLLPARRPVR
jgi:mycofactocin system glycosyltransferase